MKRAFLIAAIISASPAFAQQAPDPIFLQKALAMVQQQRNAAMDGQAQAQTQAAMLADEVAKLKARIAELEAKPAQ